ncbi:MAG: hypothetical protein Q8P27_01610 [Candidatus Peregrinibacteria bacterium]|nr:hypothetical protein [Candidatus Peregrinibacteria bacterium]
MNPSSPFEVRVSRLLLLALCGIGLIFLLFGAWLVFGMIEPGLEQYGDLTVETTVSEYARWLGLIPLGIGLLLIFTQGRYLIKPPTMLRISEAGVTFGTGFGYKPYTIPLEHLESVTNLKASVIIKFKEAEGVPIVLATSAGIHYSLYFLRLNRFYMNHSCGSVVEAIKSFQKL